jgi:hypothetical protein
MNPKIRNTAAAFGLWVALSHGAVIEGIDVNEQVERASAPITMPETHQEGPGLDWRFLVGDYPAPISGADASRLLQTFPTPADIDAIIRIIQQHKK